MMKITTFNFSANPLRVVLTDGEPWFVAADVCSALGIRRTDDGVGRLDDDEKGAASIRTPGGDQQMTVINESGLYSLILGSRKPEAKKFKKWVTSEVLPAIRKNGVYVDPTKQADLFDQSNEANAPMDMATELSLLRRLDATQSQLIDTQAQLVLALRAQLAPKPKRKPAKKLTPEDIVFMRALKAQGLSGAAIAKRMGLSDATVSYMTRDVAVPSKH